MNERFVINERYISLESLGQAHTILKECLENDWTKQNTSFELPSRFEAEIATAFLLFDNAEVDVGVIEVGLGGKYDQTNVINSDVSVITTVDYDHVEYLGSTIENIALHKAGIIKEKQFVISGVMNKVARNIIESTCLERSSVLLSYPDVISYKNNEDGSINIQIKNREIRDINLKMQGEYQKFNATLATAASIVFDNDISNKSVINALSSAEMPGRFEIVQNSPCVILDCAHNVEKIGALVNYLKKIYSDDKFVIVLAFKKGANYEEMIDILLTLNLKCVLVTGFKSEFKSVIAEDTKKISTYIKKCETLTKIEAVPNPEEAVGEALRMC